MIRGGQQGKGSYFVKYCTYYHHAAELLPLHCTAPGCPATCHVCASKIWRLRLPLAQSMHADAGTSSSRWPRPGSLVNRSTVAAGRFSLTPAACSSSPSGLHAWRLQTDRRPVNGQGCAGGPDRTEQRHRHVTGERVFLPFFPARGTGTGPHTHSRHGCVQAAGACVRSDETSGH